ncbi:MAG TPA: ElyC/SanA/YdcF family protein [Anaerolineales bacterium]|nr:ElyC/SanA/YdcF family protein [Anaerolineales bacterium]
MPFMLRRMFLWTWNHILYMGCLALLLVFLPRLITGIYTTDRLYQPPEAPQKRVAIIFGAGLRRDGTPTAMLRDRVLTGAELYFSGQVEKLLMSGDNRFADYNEPESMRQFALSIGVPDEAIVLDYAGRRTYDTCYRAKAIFGVENALLVTQGFHLPRAIFLCNMLGMDTLGVEAIHCYWNGSPFVWDVREQFATVAAFLDLYVSNPLPVLGAPEPMFVD